MAVSGEVREGCGVFTRKWRGREGRERAGEWCTAASSVVPGRAHRVRWHALGEVLGARVLDKCVCLFA